MPSLGYGDPGHFKCAPAVGRPKRDRGRNRSQRRARKANR